VNSESISAYIAAALSILLAAAGLFHRRRSFASWCFVAGMVGLGIDSALTGISLAETDPIRLVHWHNLGLGVKSLLPGIWLCFSVTYSRGDAEESLKKWRWIIALSFLIPIAVLAGFQDRLIETATLPETGELWLSFLPAAKVLNVVALIGTVLILMNLERTFRSAVGTMQWRIKFLILGLAIIFGARIYTRSQALVFSGHNYALTEVEAIGLLIGCVLIGVGYFRSGLAEIDVYPSRAVLHTSITIALVGGYLFFVGVLAQIVARSGRAGAFQLQAFLILLGIALLAVLLLSDRFRQRVKGFVSEHFKRPQYDFREIWTRFTQSTSSAIDDSSLCAAAAKLISETFNVLSVSVWLFDEEKERLTLAASTSRSVDTSDDESVAFAASHLGTVKTEGVFDLEKVKKEWGETLRSISATQFNKGGHRVCVALSAAERWLGLVILADRVSGVPYTTEEFALLKCIGDQIAASLLNLRLAEEIVFNKELEAFQTISAFFVHDLKNAASTLRLMLQNLPVHFENPDFRADALRGIGETTNNINQIIEHLGAVRDKLEFRPSELDLNALVDQAIESANGNPGVEIEKELHPLPKLIADSEQLRSVVMNLLLNARDAVGSHGRIQVKTMERNGWATLSVTDNGCGMTADFVRQSLYRPFKTTKKKGLGIGMFQTKMVIEAHQGNIRVKSEVGKGTTFHVQLPLKGNEK
jgi:putative PEP-CTERM system histidine kinase